MRLVNVKSLSLEEFSDDELPRYAILSHCWGATEVTFTDLVEAGPEEKKKPKYIKIRETAKLASKSGYSHIWIDTCCIDKRSSAELSEAINSMFTWYREAAVCYVYLQDVGHRGGLDGFSDSKWFKRGWTLQELIAPSNVEFYSTHWTFIGTKHDHALWICRITNIDLLTLSDPKNLPRTSVAKRMSWASNRQTTREEDLAYCLLGIFGVHMSLMYGERGNAFIRLQEEIIKQSADQSLFAWLTVAGDTVNHENGGILASHPREFANSHSFVPTGDNTFSTTPPYSITNKGLRIQLPLLQIPKSETEPTRYVAILSCHSEEDFWPVGIALKLVPRTVGAYYRDTRVDLRMLDPNADFWTASRKPKEIYIKTHGKVLPTTSRHSRIRQVPDVKSGFQMTAMYGDSIRPFNARRVLQLSDRLEGASVSFTHLGVPSFYLSYGLRMTDPHSTFISITPCSINDTLESHHRKISDAISNHRAPKAGRKTTMTIPNHGKVSASLSWDMDMGNEILFVDVYVPQTTKTMLIATAAHVKVIVWNIDIWIDLALLLTWMYQVNVIVSRRTTKWDWPWAWTLLLLSQCWFGLRHFYSGTMSMLVVGRDYLAIEFLVGMLIIVTGASCLIVVQGFSFYCWCVIEFGWWAAQLLPLPAKWRSDNDRYVPRDHFVRLEPR